MIEIEEFLNKIICGDSLEVMKNIPDNSIDLIFTDPPYNEKYNYRSIGFTDYRDDYYDFIEKCFIEMKRILKNTGSIYFKHSSRQIHQILPLMNKYFFYRNLIVWLNNSQAHPDNNYDSYYEPLFFYTKSDDYVFNKRAEFRKKPPNYWSGEGKEFVGLLNNMWYDIPRIVAGCVKTKEGMRDGNLKEHPCSMPVALARRAILVSTNENDIVLDPFIGSGTTAVACKMLNRKYIGIELNADFCEIAGRKIKNIPERIDKWCVK